jgi:hypothetical protein
MEKIKYTCGTRQEASCVFHNIDLPEISNITDDCFNVDETVLDLYRIITKIKLDSDLSNLDNNCINYSIVEGELKIKNVITQQDNEICQLKTLLESQSQLIASMQQEIVALQQSICN